MSHAEAYESVHRRILDLLDPQVSDVEVPTCPGWTVKDVVAHLAGFLAVYRTGDPQEVYSQGWGDREVLKRRDRSLVECVAEWEALLEGSDDLFGSRLGPVAVSDALAHEQDIRTALDRPGARDDESIVPAVEMGLAFIAKQAEGQRLPPIRVVSDEIDRRLGDGEPVATLRATTFELFRVIHGRRTPDQLRDMQWEGEPGPWLSALFLFGPAERAVER